MAADPQVLRVAMVGWGAIAQTYCRALKHVSTLQLVATVETDTATACRAREQTGLPCHPSVEECLAGEPLDAALVLTPPNSHEPITCQLLDAGVHVLCEKPLAPSLPAAQRMLAAAGRADRQLMMGSKFRYVEDIDKARQLLELGLIGEVALFENVFCSRIDMVGRWNSQRKVAGGGVLIDNGCHSADIARFLLGPITHIQARFGVQVQPLEVEDTARVLFEFESGAIGMADLSWSLHKDIDSYVRLHGSAGTLEVGWKRSRYKLEGDPEWIEFGKGYDKLSALRNQLGNFAGSILGTEEPNITPDDALSSVAVVDAAYRSARDCAWTEVVR